MPSEESLVDDLLRRLRGPGEAAERASAIRELGWALVMEGQLHLQTDEADTELFFETNGYPGREDPGVWVDRVARGLRLRLSDGAWESVAARSIERAAARYLASS